MALEEHQEITYSLANEHSPEITVAYNGTDIGRVCHPEEGDDQWMWISSVKANDFGFPAVGKSATQREAIATLVVNHTCTLFEERRETHLRVGNASYHHGGEHAAEMVDARQRISELLKEYEASPDPLEIDGDRADQIVAFCERTRLLHEQLVVLSQMVLQADGNATERWRCVVESYETALNASKKLNDSLQRGKRLVRGG